MEVQKVNVLGVGISVLDQTRAREFLFDAVRQGRRGYVTVTNVYSVCEALRDPKLLHIFNNALLSTPDGMPMVWMGRLQGHDSIRRVYGPDLLLNLAEHSPADGFTHFFYGGKPGVAADLARTLQERFPGLKVVGTYSPPFRPLDDSERVALQDQIRIARPDFLWVGIGSPKQERFIAEHVDLLPEAKILVGVGAAFDFLTGRVRQAPRWMMRAGFEWLFRLVQEPRRLAKRYLVYNPLFVARATAQILGIRKYSLED